MRASETIRPAMANELTATGAQPSDQSSSSAAMASQKMPAQDEMSRELALLQWVWLTSDRREEGAIAPPLSVPTPFARIPQSVVSTFQHVRTFVRTFDWLHPLRSWINSIEVQQPTLAHRICRLIPSQCPFERDIQFLGRTLFHLPPLCKLNPLYEEVVALRFRALCYLADECGEDVTCYC